MANIISMYFSFRSPFSYIATPQALQLSTDFDVETELRVVLPRALRAPDFFKGENVKRIKYILLDWTRRAELLGLPHAWPSPDPIVQDMENLTIAKEQPYIYRLSYLGVEANKRGKGVEFATLVSRLIFGGTKDWHQGEHLADAARSAGLDLADMDAAIESNPDFYAKLIEDNDISLAEAGHWGVPTFVYNNEPFFGQDRIDSLCFQLEKDGLKR